MGTERERTQRIIQEAQPESLTGIKGFVTRRFQESILWYAENAVISSQKEYHPDYTDDLVDAVKNNYNLAYIGSHTAWGDILALAYISREGIGLANEHLPLDSQINGAVAPLAETLHPKKKKQGKTLDKMLQAVLPLLNRYMTYPVYTVTENDRLKRGEQKNGGGFIADMLSMMRDGYSVIDILPEGSVDGGRKDTNGNRKGMQLFQEKSMGNIITLSRRLKKSGVLFIPVGIEGGWKINDPTNRFKLFSGYEGLKSGLLLTTDVRNMDPISLNVGKPIKTDEPEIADLIERKDWLELDNQMGFAIAELINPKMRGVYTNRETLNLAIEKREAQKRERARLASLSQA